MAGIQRYAQPTRLEAALELAAEGKASLLAGGTDLMLQARSGARPFQLLLLNLRRIRDLRGIEQENGTVRIGPMTTVTDILESHLFQSQARVLAVTADRFASSQVRNAATIGGNLANASPAADLAIPLILLDAEVELASWVGSQPVTRTVPISEFFTGPGKSRLEAHEILTAIRFPAPAGDFVADFVKFGARPALDIAVVSIGIAGRWSGGRLENPRVAFGAVAPIPLRGRRTEAAIESTDLNDETIAGAVRAAVEETSPISDVRASAWYRKRLVRVLAERMLHDVSRRAD